MTDAQKHTRINDILLGPLERPALRWLAAHMPRWVNSDMLSILGLLGGLTTAVSYYLSQYSPAFLWLASLGLVINWFGDSLDGTLARYRHEERPRYGYFIDHIIDTVIATAVLIGLAFSPYVHTTVALLTLISYLMLEAMVFLYTYVDNVFQISYWKLGPTEVRVIMIGMNAGLYFSGNPILQIGDWSVRAGSLVVALLGMLILLIFTYFSIARAMKLSREDEAARERRRVKEQERQMNREQKRLEREARKSGLRAKSLPGRQGKTFS